MASTLHGSCNNDAARSLEDAPIHELAVPPQGGREPIGAAVQFGGRKQFRPEIFGARAADFLLELKRPIAEQGGEIMKVAEEQVVQGDDATMALQRVVNVLVIGWVISHLIQNAAIVDRRSTRVEGSIVVRLELGSRERHMRRLAGVVVQVDAKMVLQLLEETQRIVGNAGGERRQRREERQARQRTARLGARGQGGRTACHGALEGLNGPSRHVAPAKSLSLPDAARGHVGPQAWVFQYLTHLGCQQRRAGAVGEQSRAADNFRLRRVRGGDDRGAALHCFQDRQAEPLIFGGKNEQFAMLIQGAQRLVRYGVRQDYARSILFTSGVQHTLSPWPVEATGDDQLMGLLQA